MTYPNFSHFMAVTQSTKPQSLPTTLKSAPLTQLPVSRPAPGLFSLEKLGLSPMEAFQILIQLQRSNDTLYHGGKLLNGKTYLVSANDQLFYGKPGQIQLVPVVHAYRTKCIGQQKRVLETASGLKITIHVQNGQPATAKISQRFWNNKLSCQIPQLRHMDFSNIRIEI
jgi:hypothetical protein